MRRLGEFCFRHRSTLPLMILPLVVASVAVDPGALEPGSIARDGVCLGITAIGLAIRALVTGHVPHQTSGRATARFQARVLNTSGLYSIVRHPIYVGNLFVMLGPVLAAGGWPVALVCAILTLIFYRAIALAEDAFLEARFGESFRGWAAGTPAFVPRPHRWRPPALPFSARTVIRREYHGWALVSLAFPAAKLLRGARAGDATLSPGWLALLIAGVTGYVIIRSLKYRTRILHVPGR